MSSCLLNFDFFQSMSYLDGFFYIITFTCPSGFIVLFLIYYYCIVLIFLCNHFYCFIHVNWLINGEALYVHRMNNHHGKISYDRSRPGAIFVYYRE